MFLWVVNQVIFHYCYDFKHGHMSYIILHSYICNLATATELRPSFREHRQNTGSLFAYLWQPICKPKEGRVIPTVTTQVRPFSPPSCTSNIMSVIIIVIIITKCLRRTLFVERHQNPPLLRQNATDQRAQGHRPGKHNITHVLLVMVTEWQITMSTIM